MIVLKQPNGEVRLITNPKKVENFGESGEMYFFKGTYHEYRDASWKMTDKKNSLEIYEAGKVVYILEKSYAKVESIYNCKNHIFLQTKYGQLVAYTFYDFLVPLDKDEDNRIKRFYDYILKQWVSGKYVLEMDGIGFTPYVKDIEYVGSTIKKVKRIYVFGQGWIEPKYDMLQAAEMRRGDKSMIVFFDCILKGWRREFKRCYYDGKWIEPEGKNLLPGERGGYSYLEDLDYRRVYVFDCGWIDGTVEPYSPIIIGRHGEYSLKNNSWIQRCISVSTIYDRFVEKG